MISLCDSNITQFPTSVSTAFQSQSDELIIQSHDLRQSRDVFDVHLGIYLVNLFTLKVMHIISLKIKYNKSSLFKQKY